MGFGKAGLDEFVEQLALHDRFDIWAVHTPPCQLEL